MNAKENGRLMPRGRARVVSLIESGQTITATAQAAGVDRDTVRKWVARYREFGPGGLTDRSSRPQHLYRPTPQPVVERILQLRGERCTGLQIAAQVGVSPATVSRILRRHLTLPDRVTATSTEES